MTKQPENTERSTRSVAITGVDGTGKTTLLSRLEETYGGAPGRFQSFRCPQYHMNPHAPFARLSRIFDGLSVLGDELHDPALKTCGMFLSMTLFGDVARFFESSFQPEYLVTERQAVLDSIAYSGFYKHVLKGPLPVEALRPSIEAALGPDAMEAVGSWLAVLQRRHDWNGLELSFSRLPLAILSITSLPAPVMVETLLRIYRCRFPDQLILLTLSPEGFERRLRQKTLGGAVPRELHESAHVLKLMQDGLIQAGRLAAGVDGGPRLDIVDVSELSIDQAHARISRLAGLSG